MATIVAVRARLGPSQTHSSQLGIENYLRKSATYRGGFVRAVLFQLSYPPVP